MVLWRPSFSLNPLPLLPRPPPFFYIINPGRYQLDTCGPMYLTVGDGGNVEGPYRNFVSMGYIVFSSIPPL